MINFFREKLWRILGIDYYQALRIHDYLFLKKDPYSKVGNYTYDNGALVWRWTNSPLIIGKYCSIANNVRFIVDEGYHSTSNVTSYPLVNNLFKNESKLPNDDSVDVFLESFKQKEGITIQNDVWIGMNAIIMPGVTIGNGVTIAANAIVTKNIPDYSVVAGVPGRIIKTKLTEGQIDSMNRIQWWNWDENKIKNSIDDFYKLNITQFIEKHKS